MASVYISDRAVVEIVPYTSRGLIFRLDIGPFALVYLAIYSCVWHLGDAVLLGWGRVVVLVVLPGVLLCHLLVFLGTQWSVQFNCLVSQWRVASIDIAESVRVLPAKHCGSQELVPLQRRQGGASVDPLLAGADPIESCQIAGKTFVLPELWFVFQQTKFVYSEAAGKKGFSRLEYPSEGSFQAYLDCRGAASEAALEVSFERWGSNVLDIPMPRFTDLFAEHAVAPFFVFQVLCVALWSLDDYWYYALFTLVMLFLFEAMLCLQRQKNLEMLRAMRREPSLVYVLRAGRWSRVSSEQVTPGEVVSLVARPVTVASAMREAAQRQVQAQSLREGRYAAGRVSSGMGTRMGMEVMSPAGGGRGGAGGGDGDGEALAPFDMVLMRGSCVVNEAMLTGESVPQAKTSLASAGDGSADGTGGAWLTVEDGTDSAHRKHVIFSGTKVLQHSDTVEYSGTSGGGSGGDGSSTKWGGLPTPPDRGCPCVVIRTGFETSQGQLMKTILFATERVTAGSDAETGLFLFILLVFAAVASVFVLQEGLADETRNSFKLVLHCIMILTSVIPPELPIELSLAVINSLTALTKSLIFCTEPFRIPLAGKVDICCFDKTGTLTSDNLIMKGVVEAPATTGNILPGDVASGGVQGEEGKSVPKRSSTAPIKEPLPASVLGEIPIRILAGCHSLVTLNGALVGDSVEVSTVKGLGWACLKNGYVVPRAAAKTARAEAAAAVAAAAAAAAGAGASDENTDGARDPQRATRCQDSALQPLQIVRCWSFDPSLRRMCTAIRAVSEMSETSDRTAFGAAVHAAWERSRRSGTAAASGGSREVPPFHNRIWIVAKGAPESIEPLLIDSPANYRSTFLYHMGRGSRVLALAYRALEPHVREDQWRRMSRTEAEKGLRFGGFLVLSCPLKPDAPYVVRELRDSSHSVAMITGDSVLTAVDVARQVGMIDQAPAKTLALVVGGAGVPPGSAAAVETKTKSSAGSKAAVSAAEGQVPAAVDTEGDESGSLRWLPVSTGFDDNEKAGGSEGDVPIGKENPKDDGIPFEPGRLASLSRRYALCVTGDVLTRVSLMTVSSTVSKTDPDKSSAPSASRAAAGKAGEGPSKTPSNSGSALSNLCCHVKVFARVSPSQKERVIGELSAAGRTTLMCGDGTNDVGALRLAHVGVSIVNSPELEKRLSVFAEEDKREKDQGGAGRKKNQRSSDAKRSRLLALREREEQEQDPALVKLGDASIASPFTAKTTSVGCVLSVIREGRCTLVTTLQVYKILALNCLTSAYILSALYLKGVKQGDGQMTLLGLATSAMFYCASRSQPMRRLSAARPPAQIFTVHACVSVLSQFLAHLLSLLSVTKLCEEYVNPEDPSLMPDGPFRPNTFNSAVFLLSAVIQVNTFAANYTGHPFMQSLRENTPMWWLVVGAYACILVLLSGAFPSFESWMQLVTFPEGFRGPFLAVLAADTAVVFAVERLARWLATRSPNTRSTPGAVSEVGSSTKRKASKRRKR